MDLKDVLELINYISGVKIPGSKALNLPNFNRLLKTANLKQFKRKIGLPEEYNPNTPLPRQAYNVTQMNTEDLRQFKVNHDGQADSFITFVNGMYTLPANYFYHSSLSVLFKSSGANKWSKAHVVTDDRWDEMIGSVVDYPSDKYVIANYQDTYIRILPSVPNIERSNKLTAKFSYIRHPVTPVYATVESGGFMVYDATNSVQLEWNGINVIDIISIILSDMGIALNKEAVIQMSEMKKEKGI
jgi:hypothetical protein